MIMSWIFILLCAPALFSANELKLVHVVFSHKFYAPVRSQVNSSDDDFPKELNYRYFLEQTDDMTAKMNMFELGVFLRYRYNEFLGEIYIPEIMNMRTSEYVLSMISGQLVNAGLWPPADPQRWHETLAWQPVVTEYEQANCDTVLLGTLCPSFLYEEDRVLQNERSISLMSYHKPLFDYLSKHYKSKIKRPSEVALLYSYLETKAHRGEALPYWAEGIFPNGEMRNITLLSYDLLSNTILQKQLNGGTLLKAIINDTLKYQTNNDTQKLKMSIYSGEERNLIGIMQCMDLWSPHIINPAASLIFEIYDNSTSGLYTVKLIYYTGIDNNIINLRLPGCQDFCSIEQFKKYLEAVLPEDNEMKLCQQKLKINHNTSNNGICLPGSFNYYLLLIILINFISQL